MEDSEKIRKIREIRINPETWGNSRKDDYHIKSERQIISSVEKYCQNQRNLKILGKSGKIGKKIWKPEEIPDKKIIISYLRYKPSILWRIMVKTNEIWRFEKCDQKNKNKKRIFKLCSLALEIKSVWKCKAF